MPHALRRSAPVAALVAALLLVTALPAVAHPFIRGGEVPVDSLATLTLELAHGCDTEEAGEGENTTDVSLQVPEWLRIVDVPDPGGWSVELETVEDEPTVVEVVTWTTDDPQEPAPAFDLDVVAAGEVGEERYLGVFQACGSFVYRWIGTPDQPADDPAVRVRLVEADPDSPPPSEPEPEPEPEAEPEPEPEAAPEPEPEPDAATDDPDPEATDEADGELDVIEADDAIEDPVSIADGDGGGLWWLVVLAGLVVVIVIVVGVRRGRTPGAPDRSIESTEG